MDLTFVYVVTRLSPGEAVTGHSVLPYCTRLWERLEWGMQVLSAAMGELAVGGCLWHQGCLSQQLLLSV